VGNMIDVVEAGCGILRPRPSSSSRQPATRSSAVERSLARPPPGRSVGRHLRVADPPLSPLPLSPSPRISFSVSLSVRPSVSRLHLARFRCWVSTLALRLPRGRRRQGQRSLPKRRDRGDLVVCLILPPRTEVGLTTLLLLWLLWWRTKNRKAGRRACVCVVAAVARPSTDFSDREASTTVDLTKS